MTADQIGHPTREALAVNVQALTDDNNRLRAIIADLRTPPGRDNTPWTTEFPDILAAAAHDAWTTHQRNLGVTSKTGPDGEEYMVSWETLTEPARDLDRATVRAVLNALTAHGYLTIAENQYHHIHESRRSLIKELEKIRTLVLNETPHDIGDTIAPTIEWLVNDRNLIRTHRDRLVNMARDRDEANALMHRIHTAVGIPDSLRAAILDLITQTETHPPISPIARFAGRWIAIKNGAVIADAETRAELGLVLHDNHQGADQTFQVQIHNPDTDQS